MNCEKSIQRMAEAIYGQLEGAEQQALREHIDGCSSCASEFASLKRTLDLVDRDAATRAPFDEAAFQRRLDAGLDAVDRADFQRRIGGVLAIAALLILSMLLWPGRPADLEMVQTPVIAENVQPSTQAEQFLRKARPLLLAWTNRTEEDWQDAPMAEQERARARALAEEASQLLRAHSKQYPPDLVRMLRDGERVLMQGANLEARTYEPGLSVVRHALNQKSLLFRITLYEMRGAKS